VCSRDGSFFSGEPVLAQAVGYAVVLGFGAFFAVFTSFLVLLFLPYPAHRDTNVSISCVTPHSSALVLLALVLFETLKSEHIDCRFPLARVCIPHANGQSTMHYCWLPCMIDGRFFLQFSKSVNLHDI